MIRVREAAARRAGVAWIYTYTAPDNYASANNLIRSGYRLYQPKTKWGLSDGLYFAKKL
jgi:hypothetical protein